MKEYIDVLKKYAVFSGRAARREYWMFVLWNLIVSIVLAIVLDVISMMSGSQDLSILWTLYFLAILLPSLGVSVRRLHDTGRSAWWILIGFIPLIGAIILVIFEAMDSQPGDNQYGPNPKGIGSAQQGAAMAG